MPTNQEVANLKAQWADDPHWDIENTEGFEDHHDELVAFRRNKQDEWKRKARRRLEKKADALGVPGNTALAHHIEKLESRITALEESND